METAAQSGRKYGTRGAEHGHSAEPPSKPNRPASRQTLPSLWVSVGPDGRKMHTSNYFRNVPCSLPTALGEAALGKTKQGRGSVHRLLLGSGPGEQSPWAASQAPPPRAPAPQGNGDCRTQEQAGHSDRCGLLMLSAARSALAISKRRQGIRELEGALVVISLS